jgi:hypothetical protein
LAAKLWTKLKKKWQSWSSRICTDTDIKDENLAESATSVVHSSRAWLKL